MEGDENGGWWEWRVMKIEDDENRGDINENGGDINEK